ncbi:MAG: HTH domain-containing protein, partial [Thermodesulfobacteria bacterium]|nr:HTH domain-containing protein [Thermodesulfobacteriota bacterium]
MTKLDRLLYILNKLDRGEKVRPADLAAELGVSERTVYRYINSLIDAGFPIYYDKEKQTYTFEKGFTLSKALIKTEEALIFALSRKLLEPVVGKGAIKILNQIEQKVISASKEFSSFEKILGIQGFFTHPYLFDLLRDLVRAIREHQIVEIEYEHEPGE